jgi:hypothetical protein
MKRLRPLQRSSSSKTKISKHLHLRPLLTTVGQPHETLASSRKVKLSEMVLDFQGKLLSSANTKQRQELRFFSSVFDDGWNLNLLLLG